MSDAPKAEPAPVPPPRFPRLRKLAEIALAIVIGYIGSRYGIPLDGPAVAAAEAAPRASLAPADRVYVCDDQAEDLGPGISGPTAYPAHSLVKLKAVNVKPGAALLWRVSPRADVERASTKPELCEFAAKPGTYVVELLVIRTAAGAVTVDEAIATVTVGPAAKIDPPKIDPPKSEGKLDPVAALGRITFGSSGCTATVVGPRRSDGRWDVLTASHCMRGVGSRGTMKLSDGRAVTVAVVVHQRREDFGGDLAWLVTEREDLDGLAYANLAAGNPDVGAEVWHKGFGVDKPGNREDGKVTGGQNIEGQLRFTLNVSSGDSGGGIFRTDSGELVSTVCCTAGRGEKVSMWGASTAMIREARPGAVKLADLVEPIDE